MPLTVLIFNLTLEISEVVTALLREKGTTKVVPPKAGIVPSIIGGYNLPMIHSPLFYNHIR
jgi:hypothetical protein